MTNRAILAGRVALVTGASRGIGRAIAWRLTAEGAAVVLSASRRGAHGDLDGTLDEAVASLAETGARVAGETADLVSDSERGDLIERAASHFGPIDILVNNAAMARWGLPSAVPLRDRRKLLEVNLQAPVDLAQQALPSMRERRRGWILNISSDSARQPTVPYRDGPDAVHAIAAYGASKAALDRYTEGLAHEVAADGVYVNSLAPVAIVLTQEAARFAGDIAARHPDMAEPVEVLVEAALELVSAHHVGRIVTSRALLHELALEVRSLDGRVVLGDASLPANPNGPVV